MGGITFPLLSDFWPHGGVAKQFGVLREDGKSERAIFVIDEAGIIRYIDIHDIDDQPDNEVLFSELKKLHPGKVAGELSRTAEPLFGLPQDGIVLYCTRYCPACVKARKWFAEKNIEYTEVNISTNPEAVKQVKIWADGNRTTPTLNINGTIVVGWDEDRVSELILKI